MSAAARLQADLDRSEDRVGATQAKLTQRKDQVFFGGQHSWATVPPTVLSS